MNRVFIGYDERQPLSFTALQGSINRYSSEPVSITAIRIAHMKKMYGFERMGLTPFTFSRFIVPHMCNYEGWALFLDIDIIVRADITELFKLADPKYAVMVSKNEHKFEWASVILFNCGHPANRSLTPDYVEKENGLHKIGWVGDDLIGDLPREWNHLVGYDKPRDDAKLIHYTQGIPAFPETQESEYAKEWKEEIKMCNSSLPWVQLMGNSVHAVKLNDGRTLPRFMVKDAA